MATAYVTAATVRTRLGNRAAELLDRDKDGSEDPGLLDDIIDEAGAIIDARLTQRLSTPFAAIGATPATPDIIQRIALHLCLAEIYDYWVPDGHDTRNHFGKADTLLNEILEGNFDVADAGRQTGPKSRMLATYDAGTPTYGGEDSDGVDRTLGI